ncbi:nucleolar complex protein 2 homolog isoform X2 [Anneissia japonica]|uniref:nucleolar complex protein 2 homolog isoform X2 n=1 Tax=Anneissia japonica TaxID=1529436 RepID=UPI0014258D89|nr:nucleolar complex protein 2 homolog isoform X2 [Anneissia japonica]
MSSTKMKRKLEEMSVDEFLENGIDSSDDEENIVEEKAISTTKKMKSGKKSVAHQHKNSLEKLKKSDPEFYQFLQENDEELLNFDPNEMSSDEDDPIHKPPSSLQEASEDSDEEVELEKESKSSKINRNRGKPVTLSMISRWTQALKETYSLKAFHEVTRAFKAAVRETSSEKEKRGFARYRVEGSEVFNALINMCVRHVANTLQHALNLQDNKEKKLLRPATSKKWKRVEGDVKTYLTDMIKLVGQVTEPSIISVVLRHINSMIPYASCFSKVATTLIKKLVQIWSTGEESVRILAFLSLYKITRYMPKTRLEFILKQMYLAFVRNSKFTSVTTLPLINFMQRSITEMFGINVAVTYQHGFVYIRQLAIHLRNAITVKEKDTYQSVYNWQYIHCLTLWCRVLGTIQPCDALQPLIYPLVQTAVGVIKLIPSERYYPLRFHVVRALNLLSDSTGTFVPLLPFISEVLEQTKFNNKNSSVSIKPINFAVILKLSKPQLNERAFRDGVIEQVCDLLLDHMQIHSHCIGFPELALPAVIQLKRFLKTCKVTNHSKPIKIILEKIQENIAMVTKKRDTVTFSIADSQAVSKWEKNLKDQLTPLMKHYTMYKRQRQQELLAEEAGKDRLIDDEIPTIERKEKQKKEDRVEFSDLFNSGSDSEDDILERAERKLQRKMQNLSESDESEDDLSDLDDIGTSDLEDLSEDEESGEENDEEEEKPAGRRKKERTAQTNFKINGMKSKEKYQPSNSGNDAEDIVEDFHFSSDSEDD